MDKLYISCVLEWFPPSALSVACPKNDSKKYIPLSQSNRVSYDTVFGDHMMRMCRCTVSSGYWYLYRLSFSVTYSITPRCEAHFIFNIAHYNAHTQ